MWPVHKIASIVIGLAAASAMPAIAGGITISPVVIEMSSARQGVAVTINNYGESPITLQSEAFAWRQTDGVDRDEPTDELLVVPPIVKVPANASQTFRLMLHTPNPLPMERTYHLFLEDISELQAASGAATLNFRVNHILPILIAPAGKILTSIRWKPCVPVNAAKPPVSREACVRLLNAGNRRVKVQALTLAGDGWQQALSLKTGENVLAGSEREWHVTLADGQRGVLRGVQVETARGEILQAESGGF